MSFDLDQLKRIGGKYQRLRADLAEVRPALAELIREAHKAGVTQVTIVKATGYTRDQIRQICLPEERRRIRARQATH